jgi:transcription elongation factor GreA
MASIYMTRDGRDKLETELRVLKTQERPKSRAKLAEAREKGDLSENAEYDAAKEEHNRLETRINRIQDQLSRAIIVEDGNFPDGQVAIGRTVELEDLGSGRKFTYRLVSEIESDFAAGKISTNSPVGKGLVGHFEGEDVEITVPAGVKRYKILKVRSTTE